MKIFCKKTELNKALSIVSPLVPARTTSPILEGILIEYQNGMLILTATDTNTTAKTRINAECEKEGSFVVPAKLCSAIVSKLPDEDVMLSYNKDTNKLKIKAGTSNSELGCFEAELYPRVILSEGENVINLPKEDVRTIIKKTAFSASTDDYNGILTGVLLEIKNGIMKMVAVDPFRVATYSIQVVSDRDVSVIIPSKTATSIAKMISNDGEEMMRLEIVDSKVVLKFDNTKVIVNTFSGKFIDYEKILEREGEINIRVKKDDLLHGIDRASILTTTQTNNLVKFNIKEDLLTINSLNEAGNIEEKIEIIKDGGDLVIGINSKYLKEALSSIEDEELMLNLKDAVSPCIIKPLKGDKYIYLVLPIRLN